MARAEMSRQVDFPGLCGPAVGALEPHVPWTESFLRLRRDCYQATGHPLLRRPPNATWTNFSANSSQPLLASVTRVRRGSGFEGEELEFAPFEPPEHPRFDPLEPSSA